MIIYDYIKDNRTTINKMFKIGIIPMSVINQFEIYNFYIDAQDLKDGSAIGRTVIHFDISRQYLYTTIKRLEEPL